MTRKTNGCWVLFIAVLIAGVICSARVERNAARRGRALEAAREQNRALRELEDRHRILAADQLPDGKVKALEREQAEVEALRHRLAALRGKSAGEEDHPSVGPDHETVPTDAWIYAGQKSPSAAFESALWAASRGDVDKLAGLLTFAPAVRAGLASLIAQLPPAAQHDYGTPEKLIATLMSGSFPDNVSAITAEGESDVTPSAALSVRIDHPDSPPKDVLFSFLRSPAGWQLVVPAPVASSYAMTIFGSGQPQK